MDIIEHFNLAAEFFIEEGCHITELHNTGEDAGLSIARARLESDSATRLHCLSQTIERYVIIEGRGSVEIGDQPSADVQPMDVVNIPAGVSQQIINTGETDLVFLCICTPRFKPEAYTDL
jgi:mannose-6-phosphate isomerase-like protein (cupin superfamily)